MRTAFVVLSCLVLLSIVAFGAYLWIPSSVHYQITEQFNISSSEQQITAYLGLLVPKGGPYQTVRNMNIYWPGDIKREDHPCVETIKLTETIESSKTIEAVVEYEIVVKSGFVFWVEDVQDCDLLPEVFIESDHPLIKQQSKQITSGSSIWDTYRIYAYTSEHLSFSKDPLSCRGELSALDAYIHGEGTCCEFSRLMVALSRANGIPSSVISGILLPVMDMPGMTYHSLGRHPGEAHAWVEFSNGTWWTLADPAFASKGPQILSFSRNDGRHIRYGGANLEATLYQDLRSWATIDAAIVNERFEALKYVLAADPNNVQWSTSVTVEKGWDGRWLNTVLGLGITTFILCYLRDRLMRKLVSGDN